MPANRKTFLFILTFTLAGNLFAQKATLPNSSTVSISTERLKIFALRLHPGDDLRKSLEKFTAEKKIHAGFIMTAVGSLDGATLRFADQKQSTKLDGKFEIASLVGTLCPDGVHLHISISDTNGKTIGGHLVEGCVIYTTAEIVICEARGMKFARKLDSQTGFKELEIGK